MKKSPLILVVDDEEPLLKLLRVNLTADGYRVITASNGISALTLLEEQKPDLILMDILMPNMDGYQACSMIKRDKSTRSIPVVMLTGLGYEHNKKLAEEAGADGYITKPFTQKELLDTIGKFLEIPK